MPMDDGCRLLVAIELAREENDYRSAFKHLHMI